MKEKFGKQIFKNSLLMTVFIFALEILVKINTNNNIIDVSIIRILISTIFIGSLFGLLLSSFKNNVRRIIATVISVGLTIYAWVEINLFTYMGFFMGIGNAEQGTKIVDYIKDYIAAAKIISYAVLIPLFLYLIYIWYIEKIIKQKKLNKTVFFVYNKQNIKSYILTIIIYIVSLIVLGFTYYRSLTIDFMQNKLQAIKNVDLIRTGDYSNLSVNQFGVFVYGVSDIIIELFDIEIELEPNETLNNYVPNNQKEVEPNYTRTIDDTIWNEIINNETNSTYNKLNKYFISREITPKNEYTGIFEGKNLIVVLMESVNEISINEKEFPTIYKLYNEGISFRNNYTPRNNCSTGNNEMTAMTSLFTINNTCTANKYRNNTYPEAIFNMFNKAGYYTSSYHDYTEHYYYRKIIHPKMGSQKYSNAIDLGIKWSSIYEEWPSDVSLIETSFPKFIDNDKFMTFLTTVTTHQPYSVPSENGNKHLDEFASYDYSKPVKRYLSKMKELDAALQLMLEKLEEAGKLEDTVIALFCDHYPYGLTTRQINEVLDYDVTINKEVDRTPMVIYNSGIEAKTVTKYTSIIDLLPTLLNMFNLDYDPRLYLGTDVFSNNNDRTVFSDGSWQDALGYYNNSSGSFKAKDENIIYTNEELITINNEINTRQKMSALAIRNDYFNYLNKKINKLIEEKEKQAQIIETESEEQI